MVVARERVRPHPPWSTFEAGRWRNPRCRTAFPEHDVSSRHRRKKAGTLRTRDRRRLSHRLRRDLHDADADGTDGHADALGHPERDAHSLANSNTDTDTNSDTNSNTGTSPKTGRGRDSRCDLDGYQWHVARSLW